MVCKPLDIMDKSHESLLRNIIAGDVVLFLGAGFSIGAKGRYKSEETNEICPLPDVIGLKQLLSKNVLRCALDPKETLKMICEDCQSDYAAKYEDFMRRLFTVRQIEDFHRLYKEIEWKKIFTINVDNVVETVYEDSDNLRCVYSENPVYERKNTIYFFKLHGCAVKAPGKITFSNTDYIASAAQRNDYRFEQLANALRTDTFLFIGTALDEEWDVDIKCFQSDAYKVTNKVYFVLKDFETNTIKRLKRRFTNAVFIQETTKSFIEKVIDYKKKHETGVPVQSSRYNLREILRQNYEINGYLKPDLYLGAEPTWEDIFSNHDVLWNKTGAEIREMTSSGLLPCSLIVGKPISGKTTMLYRLGSSLLDYYKVYEYIGDDFLSDLESYLTQTMQESSDIVILIDDANWLLGRIQEILHLLNGKNVKLICTIREREYEKKQHLFDKNLREKIHIINSISDLKEDDIEAYLDKLEEKSFLGRYSDKYRNKKALINEIQKDLSSKKRDPLLMLAFRIKYGDKLKERLEEIQNSILEKENYNVRRFILILYFLDVLGDVGLRLSLFRDLYPMSTADFDDLMNDIKDELISNTNTKSWKNSEYNKIVIHSRLSEIVKNLVRKIDFDELENMLEDIFRRLDSTHHYDCRHPNNYYSYVLYTMLRSQNIRELFRPSEESTWEYINRLYANLHDYYKDYHLYWLHRGILEVKMKKFHSAEIHLEQARTVRSGYSFEIEHSFAILYFDEAIYRNDLTEVERERKFFSALKIIRSQIDRHENDAFSINSFVIKVIQYHEKHHMEIPHHIWSDVVNYYYIARARYALDQSTIRRDMLTRIYIYLRDHNQFYKGFFSITQEEWDYLMRRENLEKVSTDILDIIG